MQQEKKSNVIIVGSGITGLTLSLLLAEKGVNVILLDKNKYKVAIKSKNVKESFSSWVSALNHKSIKILDRIGVWQDLVSRGKASSYTKMQISKESGSEVLNLSGYDIAADNIGFIVCNNTLKELLWKKVLEFRENIRFVQGSGKSWDPSSKTLLVESGDCFVADLLIGCDGVGSWVREQSGIEVTRDNIDDVAFVGAVQHSKAHMEKASQVFKADGVLALLPLDDIYKSVFVFSCPSTDISKNKEEIERELSKSFSDVGDICIISEVRKHAIVSQQSVSYYANRVILAGDAAVSVHPLAGLGLNLGLQEVGILATILQNAFEDNKDLGNSYYAKIYESKCKGYNTITKDFIVLCRNIFVGSGFFPGMAAKVAFSGVGFVPGLKSFFIKHALYGIQDRR